MNQRFGVVQNIFVFGFKEELPCHESDRIQYIGRRLSYWAVTRDKRKRREVGRTVRGPADKLRQLQLNLPVTGSATWTIDFFNE